MVGVGTLATGVTAEVDAHGTVHQGSLRLGWRIRNGNGWLVPGRDRPARRSRPHPAPVAHTALRISGGAAIERVYAVGDGDGGIVVVEVENDSPAAIAVAFVIDAPGVVAVGDDGVRVDGKPTVALARRPGAVEDGGLLVYPVPHRTTVRVALTGAPVDVRALADADAVVRSWDRMLDRGLGTELPEPLQSEVDAARADLLLAPPSAEAFVALEAWGFDGEAIEMWARLRMRARRGARRSSARRSSARRSSCGDVLVETRAALVREEGRTIEILPGFRLAWLGQQLAAHDVPLRRGLCSFAVRWHGARPALLWDVPPGSTVRAPELDPTWSSDEPVGETLLDAASTSLLSMGERAPLPGTSVDAPEQFS
jgi:hypothetical protein